MKKLVQEKEKAIALRRKGLSYKEILKEVPVAKSSLSLWLSDLPLTKDEKKVLRKRTSDNITHGRIKSGSELRKKRLEREKSWYAEAKEVFDTRKKETLFHTGVALYWAEGSKRTSQWSFSNSDVNMIRLMVTWLRIYTDVSLGDLYLRLYIHKPYAHENLEDWWAKELKLPRNQFMKTVYKPTQLGVKKRLNYKGCLNIGVRKSRGLLCKMKFWTNMVIEYNNKQ